MPEQFDVAAERHLRVGELLRDLGELDDAGYHFGICGEILTKHALRASGVENSWISNAISSGKNPRTELKKTPMYKHLPVLTSIIPQFQAEIALYESGRFAPAIAAVILAPNFVNRFNGWHIDIRYADSQYTPVSTTTCDAWYDDATDLFLGLLI